MGPTAKKDEVTVVQIESEGFKQEKLTVPICAMKGGKDFQNYVDLLVPCPPAKISLLQGEGPIYLMGSHCVDYDGYKEVNDEDDDEATEDEEAAESEAMKESEESKGTPSKEGSEGSGSTKRKASGDQPKSDEKKKKESPAK